MSIAVLYASKHGCAEKCARILAEKLPGARVINLELETVPPLDSFSTVIIGGSIYVGQVQKSVKAFCMNNMEQLLTKKTGLFICCANREAAEMQMRNAFPEPLYNQASVKEHFGHVFDFTKMNFMERLAIKVIAKTNKSEENVLYENMERFIAQIV